MKNNIHYSMQAVRDLDEIREYISTELSNESAADSIVNMILDRIEILSDFSGIGVRLSPVVELKNDYRFLVCGNYLAFYRVEQTDVYVDRILYGKMNYMKILFDGNAPNYISERLWYPEP